MKEQMKNKEIDTAKGEVEESRRRFLKKAGKLAIYTPPAMAMMMQPSQASFLKSGGIRTIDHEEWEGEIEGALQRLVDYIKSL